MKIKLDPGAYLPERAHEIDAGYDLRSPVRARIYGGSAAAIDTGVHMQIPEGFAGVVRAKSGLNFKHSIMTDGLIDSGYTGSIHVKLYNLGEQAFDIDAGNKIAQIVIQPIYTPELEIVSVLDETERGNKGFGSTGR